jgi:hypothetical protein
MEMEKVDYYEKAIKWATNYLESNTEPKEIKFKLGETITDDLVFVSTNLCRLQHSVGREKQGSYNRIRILKQYLEKNP